jgi:hypothetical protein
VLARARSVPNFLTLVALAVLLVPGVAFARARAQSVLPTLYVQYAMNCTFTITDDAGKTVSSIAPGPYQVTVTTPSPFAAEDPSQHDFTACKGFVQFQLTGPGVNLYTTLDDGDGAFYQFTATFSAGSTYTAQDNNQPSVARGVFTAAATGSPSTPSLPAGSGGSGSIKPTVSHDIAGSAVVPFRGSLAGTVDAAGRLALTTKGKPVGTLKAGLYTFAVVDKSAKSGFSIEKLARGVKTSAIQLTGVGYKGTHVATLNLKAGQWTFFTPGGKKTYFIAVA